MRLPIAICSIVVLASGASPGAQRAAAPEPPRATGVDVDRRTLVSQANLVYETPVDVLTITPADGAPTH